MLKIGGLLKSLCGECIGNNGKKGILAVKHLDLDQEGQLDGRNVYLRCTPYLRSGEDYCTGSNDSQYFDVELFCDIS